MKKLGKLIWYNFERKSYNVFLYKMILDKHMHSAYSLLIFFCFRKVYKKGM